MDGMRFIYTVTQRVEIMRDEIRGGQVSLERVCKSLKELGYYFCGMTIYKNSNS